MSETARLADQIRRAFDGEAWHGDSVLKSSMESMPRWPPPIRSRTRTVSGNWFCILPPGMARFLTRMGGAALELRDEQNFPPVKDTSEAAWRKAIEHANRTHSELVKAVAAFPDSRLQEQVPGKTEGYHDFFYTFSGIVQHELYHAGQIALLKKAQSR